jgi:hypothetical protein
MPSRSNALHDRLPSGRDRLVQNFDNAEFFSGFEHRRFYRARDCDYQQIWIRVMEFLNQREPASRQRKITNTTENPRRWTISKACSAVEAKNTCLSRFSI